MQNNHYFYFDQVLALCFLPVELEVFLPSFYLPCVKNKFRDGVLLLLVIYLIIKFLFLIFYITALHEGLD